MELKTKKMKYYYSFICLLLFGAVSAQSPTEATTFDYNRDFKTLLAETQKSGSAYYYDTQLKKFNIGAEQTDMEVLALLIGFTANEHYQPYRDIFVDKALYDLNEEEKYLEVIEKSDLILAINPFLIKVMKEKQYAYSKLGKQAEMDAINVKMVKIYNAMYFSSTDGGKTIGNAMFALHPKDGQYFIKYVIKSKIGTMGSGSDGKGNFIDILEAKIDGESVMMYFNVDHAARTMMKK